MVSLGVRIKHPSPPKKNPRAAPVTKKAQSGQESGHPFPSATLYLQVAQRPKAQRRAQRSGASPLKRRVGPGGGVEPGHDATIRLRCAGVQRAGACVGRKPLSRKSRGSPAEGSLPAPARMDLKQDAGAGHGAAGYRPGPRNFKPSPNGLELTGDGGAAAGVRCSDVLVGCLLTIAQSLRESNRDG